MSETKSIGLIRRSFSVLVTFFGDQMTFFFFWISRNGPVTEL